MPVYFLQENVENIVFLTKSGILRNSSTILECQEGPIVFNIGKNIITMFNKTARINKKKLINILKLTKYIFKNDLNISQRNESYSFFDYYFQNFAKNKVFITIRDIIEYIFMLIVAVFFKNKYVNFIEFIKKIISKQQAKGNRNIKPINIIPTKNKVTITNNSTIIKLLDGSNATSLKNTEIVKSFEVAQSISSIICKNCKDCKDRRCPCKRDGEFCNPLCHNGESCQNQRNF